MITLDEINIIMIFVRVVLLITIMTPPVVLLVFTSADQKSNHSLF